MQILPFFEEVKKHEGETIAFEREILFLDHDDACSRHTFQGKTGWGGFFTHLWPLSHPLFLPFVHPPPLFFSGKD